MTRLVFRNVRVFPGSGDRLLPPQDVTVDGSVITDLRAHDQHPPGDNGQSVDPSLAPQSGPHPSSGADPETTVIDGGGRTLMPGLIDAHWHAAFAAVAPTVAMTADPYYILLVAAQQAASTLMRGFTTVRDCGGPTFGLKRAIDEGVTAGPRIYPSGAMISQTSGHGDFRLPYEVPADPCRGLTHIERVGGAAIADGADAVLRVAREQLMLGASQIKVMAGGGVSSSYDPLDVTQYTEREIRSAVDAAENWGTYVMVHAYTPRSISQALRAGVRCIEHGQLMDQATIEQLIEADAWWCLQPFLGDEDANPKPPHLKAKQDMVAAGTVTAFELAIEHGANVAWGTDTLFAAAQTAAQGKQLVKLRRWYTPAQVLALGTSRNADLLALSGPRNPYPGILGRVESGAIADLLLVDGDPLSDLDLIADPHRNFKVIVKNGAIHKNTL